MIYNMDSLVGVKKRSPTSPLVTFKGMDDTPNNKPRNLASFMISLR